MKIVAGPKKSLKKTAAQHPVAGKTRMTPGAKPKRFGTRIDIDATGGPPDHGVIRNLRFGAVTVSNINPDFQTLVINVKAGRDALGRAKEAFIKPGVRLHHHGHIPKFRVDAHDPKILIREIDGRVDRGSIVNGAFVSTD